METKQILNLGMEIKEVDDKSMTFTAIGSVAGVKDSDGDIIENGAFDDVVIEANKSNKFPKLLYQHDRRSVLGIISGIRVETLLGKDVLYFDGKISNTTLGKDVYILLKDKAIFECSIGFYIKEYTNIDPSKPYDGKSITKIRKIPEISLVTFPSNEDATVVNVKQKDDIIDVRVLEKHLREANLSRNEAKAIISGGIPKLKSQREADTSKEDTLKAFNDVLCALKLN